MARGEGWGLPASLEQVSVRQGEENGAASVLLWCQQSKDLEEIPAGSVEHSAGGLWASLWRAPLKAMGPPRGRGWSRLQPDSWKPKALVQVPRRVLSPAASRRAGGAEREADPGTGAPQLSPPPDDQPVPSQKGPLGFEKPPCPKAFPSCSPCASRGAAGGVGRSPRTACSRHPR